MCVDQVGSETELVELTCPPRTPGVGKVGGGVSGGKKESTVDHSWPVCHSVALMTSGP